MKHLKKEFWRYMMFAILGMIGSSGTILADTFFVSHRLGSEGLAALNIAIAIFGLLNGLGMIIGIGGATRYSIYKAQQRHGEANQTVTLSFQMTVGLGCLFFFMGLYGASGLAKCLGANQAILPLCTTYLRTILMFAPSFLLNHLFMSFVRHDGSPQLAMLMMISGSLTNIVLDYLFMYPLHMGILGAALATGLAPTISVFIACLYIFLQRHGFHLTRTSFQFSQLLTILKPGLSSFINEFSSSLVLVVFNLLILKLEGHIGVAAYGIVANLALIVLAIFTGVAQGLQPLLSRAYGQGQSQEIQYLYKKGCYVVLSIGICVLCMAYLLSSHLVALFNHENHQTLQLLADEGMRYYFIGFLFIGYNYLTISLLSTTNQVFSAFRLSLLRGCIGIIMGACLFTILWGMTGIWLAFPCVEFITMLIGKFKFSFRHFLEISK